MSHLLASRKVQLIALCIICALVYVWRFMQAGPNMPDAVTEAPETQSNASLQPARRTTGHIRAAQQKRMSEVTWTRDPFADGMRQGGSAFSLAGILWDPNKPLAIINGQTLGVGETVDGFKVLVIAADHVTVSDGQQTIELPLNAE